MNIYEMNELEIKNKKTGKIYKEIKKQLVGFRCDYSGRLIDDDYSCCLYNCDYGLKDPGFGDEKEENKLSEMGVDVFDLMSQPYHFYSNNYYNDGSDEYYSAELEMLKEITKMKIGNRRNNFLTLESILRFFRARTALKLIGEGVIKPEDLNVESEYIQTINITCKERINND